MALFVVTHRHEQERCPAGDPAKGSMLLRRLSEEGAERFGVTIHAEAMIDGLECGKISVNSPGFPYPGLPEGGKKASGYGRDLGPESLDGYLHSKSVIYEQS